MGELGHQELLGEFAREYMAEHPDVEVVPTFQGLHGALYQKLIAAITAGNPPAMAQMFEGWTTRLYDRGRLVPVARFVDGPNGYSARELDDFYAPFIEDNRWGDTLVSMPFNKSAFVLQYNVDLLRRAGYDRPPDTWDELREAARAVSGLRDADGRPCRGLLLRPRLETFTTFLFSAGGSFLDENFEPDLDSESARESMALIEAMVHEDKTAFVDATYPSILLGTGSVGMFIHSSAAFPFNSRYAAGRFEWSCAPVPGPGRTLGEDGSRATMPLLPSDDDSARRRALFQGYNVALMAGQRVDNPAELQAAAWDFLKFMLEPERVARWSMQTGYCPVRRSALEIPAFRDYLAENPPYRTIIELIDRAEFEPKPDFWESWRTAVGDEVVAVLQGLASGEDALAKAQAKGLDAIRFDSKFPPHRLGRAPGGEAATLE